MAGIDKTYVNKEQLLEVINWAKNVGEVVLENGYKFKPIKFICSYNDLDNLTIKDTYVLWNTPIWFDRWLWCNCPLSFIRLRLQEQYDSQSLENFESWTYEKPVYEKRKYTFLQEPIGRYWKYFANGKGKKKSIYYVSVLNAGREFGYDAQTNTWGEMFGMLPYQDEIKNWCNKVPSKKSIMRLLRKWNLPKNCIVLIKNLHYYGMDYKILVK